MVLEWYGMGFNGSFAPPPAPPKRNIRAAPCPGAGQKYGSKLCVVKQIEGTYEFQG